MRLGVLDKYVDRNYIKLIKRGIERGYVFMYFFVYVNVCVFCNSFISVY